MKSSVKLEDNKASYDRIIKVVICESKCNKCCRIRLCLCCDSSEGEYGSVDLCTDCLGKIHKEMLEMN